MLICPHVWRKKSQFILLKFSEIKKRTENLVMVTNKKKNSLDEGVKLYKCYGDKKNVVKHLFQITYKWETKASTGMRN